MSFRPQAYSSLRLKRLIGGAESKELPAPPQCITICASQGRADSYTTAPAAVDGTRDPAPCSPRERAILLNAGRGWKRAARRPPTGLRPGQWHRPHRPRYGSAYKMQQRVICDTMRGDYGSQVLYTVGYSAIAQLFLGFNKDPVHTAFSQHKAPSGTPMEPPGPIGINRAEVVLFVLRFLCRTEKSG